MRRADRLFQILQLLRSRRCVTAADLSDALGVSVRTVYRDVRDLQGADVPIRGEAGVGYVLDRSYDLPPMSFTTPELEALVLGARMVEAWADPELAEAARSALLKIEAAVPRALQRVLLETPLYALSFGKPELGDAFTPIRHAIAQRRRVRIRYQTAEGEVTDRVIRPLALHFWGRVWSLAAWCELREGFRNFRPDRVSAVEVLDVAPNDGIDLEAFRQEMRNREGGA